jgi:hypothetical protein
MELKVSRGNYFDGQIRSALQIDLLAWVQAVDRQNGNVRNEDAARANDKRCARQDDKAKGDIRVPVRD